MEMRRHLMVALPCAKLRMDGTDQALQLEPLQHAHPSVETTTGLQEKHEMMETTADNKGCLND